MVKPWRKEGEPIILAKRHHKNLLTQRFFTHKDELVEWTLFNGDSMGASVILPVTQDNSVVAIEEYKCGSLRVQIELPCGGMEDDEIPYEAAARELMEETGYKFESMIQLAGGEKIWIDTSCSTGKYYPFLARGCSRYGLQKFDQYEDIEVKEIPLEQWFKLIRDGKINDAKTITVTHLALTYLLGDFFLKDLI